MLGKARVIMKVVSSEKLFKKEKHYFITEYFLYAVRELHRNVTRA